MDTLSVDRVEGVDSPELPQDLEPLAFLLGEWAGRGVGDYPTIERFEYLEKTSFRQLGKPFLAYEQRTRTIEGAPLHTEMGYWIPGTGGKVELLLAHPFGVVEIAEGNVDGAGITLRSRTLAASSTGAEVEGTTRHVWLDGDTLRYTFDMAAEGQPLQRHLEAELRRAGG